MNRGLAISTVLLLLAAIWLPLAVSEGTPEHEFSPQTGDDLSAYGRGYVENLMLWSGAGIGLEWGPSFGGNGSALDARMAELETEAGGDMPANTTPLLVPFTAVDPAFAGPAPIDHSQPWQWDTSAVEARVTLNSVASTVIAETDLAGSRMEGDTLDAEGLLLVLSALEAVRFIDQDLGWDGTVIGPINMSDPNMTDNDASNGWWLPASRVMGQVNETTTAWEDPVVEMEDTLGSSMLALSCLLTLGGYLSTSPFLMGGNLFPTGIDIEVLALANALYNNIIAVYYDADVGLFIDDEEAKVDDIAWSYFGMVEYSQVGDMVEYNRGWAESRAMMAADMLVKIQNEDGSMALGVTTAVGGAPEAYLPPYLPMPGMASHGAQSMAAAVLYDASSRFGGLAYAAAAKACLAADDTDHWDDGHQVYVQDPMAATTSVYTGDQVAAFLALKSAVDHGDVDLARYRITQTWGGMVAAGLQLSETDLNGEDYGIPEPDTNNNTIWKHDWDHGMGDPNGVGPVLAAAATYDDGTGNWTLTADGMVDTFTLMMAARMLMDMDGDWFTDAGAPQVSEEQAFRLLNWTPVEWKEFTDDLSDQVMNLTEQVAELEDIIANGSGEVSELMAQIASLQENLTAMEEDLNESRENETILAGQVDWLRDKLETTNGTVDDMEKQITVLESKVERLEESVGEKDENITKLQDQLRSERNNVTQLKWQMENASAAVAQAEKDLASAERELEDTEDKLSDQESRQALVAVAALVAGMIIVVVLLKLLGKL